MQVPSEAKNTAKLELQVDVACLEWVLGAKHGSSTEEMSTLNH